MIVRILVGKPGSGKSTYSADCKDFTVINQDTLGNRKRCLQVMEQALKDGKNVIVDRTNINKEQRGYFITLAKKYNVDRLECVEFVSDSEECVKRINERKHHPTITTEMPIDKKREIVLKFEHSYEEPSMAEGFDAISTFHTDNLIRAKSESPRD